MKDEIARLHAWIKEVPSKLQAFEEPELALRPQPGKWSKKEILGHLCDSALTNLQRFVRAQHEPLPYKVLTYNQDQWVERMNYRNLPSGHILNLWVVLNKQVAEVIANIPDERLLHSCRIADGSLVTLDWLVTDYVDHMEHHLNQIFRPFE